MHSDYGGPNEHQPPRATRMTVPPQPSKLRDVRLAAGLSAERLAWKVECSAASIRHAEHGMGSDAMFARIADALGVGVEDIR